MKFKKSDEPIFALIKHPFALRKEMRHYFQHTFLVIFCNLKPVDLKHFSECNMFERICFHCITDVTHSFVTTNDIKAAYDMLDY
jgi:hypothetical protein